MSDDRSDAHAAHVSGDDEKKTKKKILQEGEFVH